MKEGGLAGQAHPKRYVRSSPTPSLSLWRWRVWQVLVTIASLHRSPRQMVSYSIYGVTLVVLYAASTAYHGIQLPRANRLLRTLDHAAIYLLIAGTYTPSGERIEIFGSDEERRAAFKRMQAIVDSEGANLLYVKEEIGHYYVETQDSAKLTQTGELGFRIAALIVTKDTVEYHIARTFQLKESEWWGLVNKVVTKSVNEYVGVATLSASESTTGNTQIFVAPNAAEIAEAKMDNMLGASKMSNGMPPEFTNDIVDAHEFGHAWANAIMKLPTNSDESLFYARRFENAARARHSMRAFRVTE
ncbi:MAG TPA: hemolysin III family protein [Blastocatellia bacterium]|nr:hemolysin III family protein [Blastocatellia bacterium]